MINDSYYFLVPYCFVVTGSPLSLIFNAQKGSVTYINEGIESLINLFDNKSISEIEMLYSDQPNLLRQTISYLKDRGIIGIRKSTDLFPNLDLCYISPEHIKHLVVEYSRQYNINTIVSIVNTLLVKFMEIRFPEDIIEEDLEYALSEIYKSSIKSIQLVASHKYTHLLSKICERKVADIIGSIIFYDSHYSGREERHGKRFYYVKKNYHELCSSNNDYLKDFIFDLKYFLLSHSFNPYYYKRLCIDKEGYIKNCLKNDQIYGNIRDKDIDIIAVINSPSFQKLWGCTCDHILEIKDNPLRYNMYVTNKLKEVENGLFSIIS